MREHGGVPFGYRHKGGVDPGRGERAGAGETAAQGTPGFSDHPFGLEAAGDRRHRDGTPDQQDLKRRHPYYPDLGLRLERY